MHRPPKHVCLAITTLGAFIATPWSASQPLRGVEYSGPLGTAPPAAASPEVVTVIAPDPAGAETLGSSPVEFPAPERDPGRHLASVEELLAGAPLEVTALTLASGESLYGNFATGMRASHELGWVPDDDLAVTALERFADLLPNVRQIAGAPMPSEVLSLTVDDIVRLTLENSSTLRQQSYSPRIQAHEVPRQRGNIFDTEVSFSATAGETDGATAGNDDFVSERRTYAFEAGLSQRLATGALLDLTASLSRSSSNSTTDVLNPSYPSDAVLTITQPLLRGFGPTVTRAPIVSAALGADASLLSFKESVIETVANAMNTYWDLFFAIQQAQVRLISLEQARLVYNNNRIRLRVGDMTRAEVLQASSTVAQREGDYFAALRSIQDTEDALWLQIDRSGLASRWETAIVPVSPPILEPMNLSEDQLLALAYALRPDLRAAQLQREQAEISRRVAANSLLPQLDVFGTIGFAGLGGTVNNSYDRLGTFDFERWVVGVRASYPLQNRAARHGLRQSELRLEQADTGLESLRLQIILDIRNTQRRLQNALDLLAAREAEVRARDLELRDEQRRYEVGLSTTEILLRFQNDQASARINRLSAVVDYIQALIELDRVTGRLLETHGVVIDLPETGTRL